MSVSQIVRFWVASVGGLNLTLTFGITNLGSAPVWAQVVPDNTLGMEQSTVNKIDALRDRIDGGAIRGSNLFHSFLEFGVGQGKGIYFSNPTGIDHILARVTGNKPSQIFGQLGVLGSADLFFVNPNGILFGKDATLDVKGSFVATTASGIQLSDQGFFGAISPQNSTLLSVSPKALFLNQLSSSSGNIETQGSLRTGKDLILAANRLDLQGQLFAGRDLILQGLDTVKIRDFVHQPFVADAQGNLQIQGNQKVDIFALNHPESGLFSGSEMLLRSDNSINGDAHFDSGGSFRFEKTNGDLTGFVSLQDPVLRISGDVTFGFYQGTSLHIFAGGSVTVPGYIWITGPEAFSTSISETVALSDSTSVLVNGAIEPTLDIRAGTTAVGNPFFNTGRSTSANIDIGTIIFLGTNAEVIKGKVLLTNQYKPNASLEGDIHISATQDFFFSDVAIQTNGGSVFLDSKGNIKADGAVFASPDLGQLPFSSNGGNVKFLAGRDIIFSLGSLIVADGLLGGGVTLKSPQDITFEGGGIFSASLGGSDGDSGGNIDIHSDSLSLTKGTLIETGTFGKADSGNLSINTKNLLIQDGSQILTATWGEGDAGHFEIDVTDSITLTGSTLNLNCVVTPTEPCVSSSSLKSQANPGSTGNAGNLILRTKNLFVQDGAQISSGTFGDGNGALLDITATDSIVITGFSSFNNQVPSGLFTQANPGSVGDAGDLKINTKFLSVQDGAEISSGAFLDSKGSGGNLEINASESIRLLGSPNNLKLLTGLFATTLSSGNGGDLTVNTKNLSIQDGAQISSEAGKNSSGSAGDLNVIAIDWIELTGTSFGTSFDTTKSSSIRSDTSGLGNAGNLNITTTKLILNDGSQIASGSSGFGNGAKLTINASDFIRVSGISPLGIPSGLFTKTDGAGNSGNMTINTGELIVERFGLVSSGSGSEFNQQNILGDGGDLEINSRQVTVQDGGQIGTATLGEFCFSNCGNAGNLIINASDFVKLDGSLDDFMSGLATVSSNEGKAGDLKMTTRHLTIQNGAIILSGTSGKGFGGDININTQETILDRGFIISSSLGLASAGNIEIVADRDLIARNGSIGATSNQGAGGAINFKAKNIQLYGDTDIRSDVAQGAGGGGDITFTADSIIAFDGSDILAFARDGQGGDITLNTPVFFGARYQPAPLGTDPNRLDGNDRVDINASGAVSGQITLPDLSFITNNLTELPDNLLDADKLIANSCVVPSRQQEGKFIITGSGGLPERPGDVASSAYPTGAVQAVPEAEGSVQTNSTDDRKPGRTMIEPQGVYQLTNGQMVLSRECP